MGIAPELGVILGGFGVVVSVVALMVAAEVSRRTVKLIDASSKDIQGKLAGRLSRQDAELKEQREHLFRAVSDLKDLMEAHQDRIQVLEGRMDHMSERLNKMEEATKSGTSNQPAAADAAPDEDFNSSSVFNLSKRAAAANE